MKILVIHNAYQHSGGEDAVVEAETSLLRRYGHDVQLYHRHNDEINSMSKAEAAVSAIWSKQAFRDIEKLCEQFEPDVIHAHNTFPLISPSFSWIATRRHIPIIQTLHNFRLLCPQATLLRNGQVCEECVGKLPWRAITRKCYRDSVLQSTVVASMLTVHRSIGTYRDRITHYIALNTFCRDKFIQGGLPANRFRIKPNFVTSQRTPAWENRKGGLYVGRLSPEKGPDILISALSETNLKNVQVIGGGPLESLVRQSLGDRYLGVKSHEEVIERLHTASYLVAPSTCYETFGLAIVEAFSCGTPAIASNHGGFAELVKDGVTGLLFNPGDAADLARKIAWAEANPDQMLRMGCAARAEYEAKYTPERNYHILYGIYEEAIRYTQEECQIA
jgi:glycosyltransferase involved in cell wall biosynthesis